MATNNTECEGTERIALFPGSFNPFTVGHLSILERAMPLFDRIVIVVGVNGAKHAAVDVEKRIADIGRITASFPTVEVMAWDGLMADLASSLNARFMVRGVRTAADFDYEYTLATVNRNIAGIETILLPALPEHLAISSSIVRELQHFGHDASDMLPR